MTRQVQEEILALAQQRIVEIVRRAAGADESVALKMAAEILAAFRLEFGGGEVYFPKLSYDPHAVLEEMRAGRGRHDICNRHGLSNRTYWRLLARFRAGQSSGGS